METGLVSNIQRYSVKDGPGIRTTVFFKGCPLNCSWCHNPENIVGRPELVVIESRCIRCGTCAAVCPVVEGLDASKEIIRGRMVGRCRLCGACVEACPTNARRMIGSSLSTDAVMREISADRVFYEESGGGVTFSGGEPLMQFDFLMELLEKCRKDGVHTSVDTCGYAPPARILAVAEAADMVLYDLKFLDDSLHVKYCGVSNHDILDNLCTLAGRVDVRLRIPVIPGVNDTPDEVEAMARFISALRGVPAIDLLPYHRLGTHKLERLGRKNGMKGIDSAGDEIAEAVALRFGEHGLKAGIIS
ncbi:MAG: glycyl-radical enzyme activating protein [Verrucomicrobia bacterium]|nr:glycyl-radical enzyme activating protein [Verrucomicrobiota bacterium]